MLKLLLREPLLHFLAAALLIFFAYGVLNPAEPQRTARIVVSSAKIEQLSGLFAKTWRRPPTTAELKGLIDDFVKEEIYYREAVALGLDRDDTVIRRRLRQKMQFLTETFGQQNAPTDAELASYLQKNAEKYALESKFTFDQIYFRSGRENDDRESALGALLHTLRSDAAADPSGLGDPTMLPRKMEGSTASVIAGTFGSDFAESLVRLPVGTWEGPITSSYGVHFVRVLEHEPGRAPGLDETRAAAMRDWMSEQRKRTEDAMFSELLKSYQITVEEPRLAKSAETP